MWVWWCNTGRFFWASCLQTLTARINLSNTLFERETPRHQYSKATIRKTNANHQYWRVNTPLSKFQHFPVLKIVTQFRTGAKCTGTARTDYEDARWSLKIGNNSSSTLNSNLLTNWRWIHATISQRVNFRKCCIANWCKVNGKLKTCKFTLHWRCSIAENFTLCEIVPWFCREFVSKLEFRVLVDFVEVSSISRPGSSARLHSLCALFQCVLCLSGTALRPVLCYLTI